MPTRLLNLPARILNRTAAHCVLALAALAVGLEPLLVRSLGSHAPAWSHWWCSASSAAAASHAAGGGGLGSTTVRTSLQMLAVHWPHFLPILLALATLVYLWRANEVWRAEAPGPASARTSRTLSG